MLLTYFDEVKPVLPDQPYFWLGGLMVDDGIAPRLEEEINVLATSCFGGRTGLTRQTEFHAVDIVHGKGNFKGVPNPKERFDLLKQLVRVYAKPEGVYRVTSRIEVEKLYSGVDAQEKALMFLIEKVDGFAGARNTRAMLIGDFEREGLVEAAVQSLSAFRENGTPYAFGKDIEHLVDTIHFARSHHSRLLQLADVYLWTEQLRYRRGERKELTADLLRFINDETSTGLPTTYKRWPPESVAST